MLFDEMMEQVGSPYSRTVVDMTSSLKIIIVEEVFIHSKSSRFGSSAL